MAKQTPAQQAAAAAYAATPTPGSINRQYQQSENNVMGFGTALAQLLHSMGGAGAGYASAIQRQSGIDSAAQNALAATGSPYAAGSGAAVAGLGSSALSALNANAAAANSYSAKQPGIAAGRAQYGVQSLEAGRQNALQQRQDEYRQAYTSALAQARQQAEAIREFNQNMGLQNRQLGLQRQEFQAGQAYKYAALAQNQNQFKASQAQQWQEYLAGLQAKINSGTASGTAQWSRTDVQSWEKQGAAWANTAILHGLPIKTTISQMVQQGIPRQIALVQAQIQYGMATRPTKDQFTHNAGTPNATFNKNAYDAAMKAYLTVTRSLAQWVNSRQWARAKQYGASRDVPSSPGHGTPP